MCENRVLFVTCDDFSGPGTKQVYHFANELARLGCEAMVLIPGDSASVREMDFLQSLGFKKVQYIGYLERLRASTWL